MAQLTTNWQKDTVGMPLCTSKLTCLPGRLFREAELTVEISPLDLSLVRLSTVSLSQSVDPDPAEVNQCRTTAGRLATYG